MTRILHGRCARQPDRFPAGGEPAGAHRLGVSEGVRAAPSPAPVWEAPPEQTGTLAALSWEQLAADLGDCLPCTRHRILSHVEREEIKRLAWGLVYHPEAPIPARARAIEAIIRCWWDRSREVWHRRGWRGHPPYERYLRAVLYAGMTVPGPVLVYLTARRRVFTPLAWLPGGSVVAPNWRELEDHQRERARRRRRTRGRAVTVP